MLSEILINKIQEVFRTNGLNSNLSIITTQVPEV